MKNNTFVNINKIFKIIIFIIILIIFIIPIIKVKNNDFIKNINEFIQDGTKVLYITDEKNYSDYPINIFKKYEIDYLYLDSTNFSKYEKSKLEKIINSKYLTDIIVIYEDGEIVDAIIEYEDEESLNVFLQQYKIIPEVISDIKGIFENVKTSLESSISIMYLPYKLDQKIEEQDKILSKLSKKYDIEYNKINAYLLSGVQQQKLNSILQISSVDDQIVIFIKDGKITGSVRGINDRDEYKSKLYEYKLIYEITDYVNNIDYDEFIDLISSKEKSIILVGKENSKDCETIIEELKSIIIENDIKINYFITDDIDKIIQSELKKIDFNDGFTLPIMLIMEDGRLLDYVIGVSSKEFYIDIFTENGIIK